MDPWFAPHLPTIVNNAAVDMNTNLKTLLSVLVGIYPKVELLNHVVIPLLFLGIDILFFIMACTFLPTM